MSRVGALLLKELWQHGGVVLAVAVFVGFVQGVLLLGMAVAPRTITMLEAHASFVRILLPFLGIALGRRLIVREYHGHTQRFLEALPIRRGEIFATKYFTGLAVIGGATLLSLLVASAAALIKEPLTFQWLHAVFVRSEVYAFALWSFFCTMGLLGRWRIPLYFVLFVCFLYIGNNTDFELSRFGPFALIGETLVLERHTLPATDLGVTLLLALGLTGLGAGLALSSEGSFAEALAKPMSRRDKIAIGVALPLLLIAYEVVDPKTAKEPYTFESPNVARAGAISVLYLDPSQRGAARALAERVAADLDALFEALDEGEDTPRPRVFVSLWPTLAAHAFERVALEDEDALSVRAHYTAPGFDEDRFVAFLIERALEVRTDGRAALEPRAWVRSGTAGWWATRHGRPDLRRAAWWRRQRRPRYQALDRFRLTEERFGAAIARNVATSAALATIDEVGEERWLEFARATLAPDPPPGIFAAIAERSDPTRERFFRVTGFASEAAFVSAWERRLSAHGELPRARATLEVDAVEGELRTIRWAVVFDAPPEPGTLCALVHAPLGPFDDVLTDETLLREERPCADLSTEGEPLVGRYSVGERVFLAVEIESLDAWIRLRAERREME